MPLELTPLDPEQLSPGVAKVTGAQVAAPAKLMAAKGMAPLGPQDLVTAVYQLSCDTDAAIATAAKETASKLPANILGAALKEPLDARVLEFFSGKVLVRPERDSLIEAILLNRNLADETVVGLSATLGERELEIIAGNQERVLRCPPIIESLYFNRNARMSTVDRLLELAIRHGLTLSNIPQFKELAASILGTSAAVSETKAEEQAVEGEAPAEDDDLFNDALGEDWEDASVGRLDDKKEKGQVDVSKLSVSAKIRLATLGNASHRGMLIKDPIRPVAMAAIHSPAVSEQEAVKYAADRMLGEEIIREIARRKDWQKSYQIKVNLANNPKTPLAISMRYLSLLRTPEVRAISRSKSVPSALATAAKKKVNRA